MGFCQALAPNLIPQTPWHNPNPIQPSSKPKLVPRGLGLTLKSWGPLTLTIIFKQHLIGVYFQESAQVGGAS